jgi:ribosomal protein L39E
MNREINRRIARFDRYARNERRLPPWIIQAGGSGSGGSGVQTAIITATLDRGGDEVEGSDELTAAVDKYRIKLSDLPAVSIGTQAVKDSAYSYGENDWQAKKNFTAEESSLPPNSTFWQEYEGTEAGVLHQTYNLLQCSPWFQVGDQVPVIYTTREGDEEPAWWILATARRVEESDGTGSLYWDQNAKREMAVFK